MNTTHLNTIGEKVIVKGGGSSGGGKSNYKYYDCLFEEPNENGEDPHGRYIVDNTKTYNFDTGEITIAPEAYSKLIAVAVDTSKRIYFENRWVSVKDFLMMIDGFYMDAHTEITEEEFFHIPEDKVFDVSTAEGRKEAYETLFPLVSRYYPDKSSVPTYPWFKSLSLSIGDDNGDRKIDVINYYGGNVLDFGMIQLEKKGNEYVLIAVAG